MADQIATYAAAANLIATTLGTLPDAVHLAALAVRAYRWMEPWLGRNRKAVAIDDGSAAAPG